MKKMSSVTETTNIMPNRNPIKRWFITFPQSGKEAKDQFSDKLAKSFPVLYSETCEELHKDGNPHLHMALFLKEKTSRKKLLTYFQNEYPNDYKRIDVDPIRKPTSILTYVRKEDKEPYIIGDCPFPNLKPLPYPAYQPIHEEYARTFGFASVVDLLAALPLPE